MKKSQSISNVQTENINGITSKQVEQFKYLVPWIASDVRCHRDVRTHTAIA